MFPPPPTPHTQEIPSAHTRTDTHPSLNSASLTSKPSLHGICLAVRTQAKLITIHSLNYCLFFRQNLSPNPASARQRTYCLRNPHIVTDSHYFLICSKVLLLANGDPPHTVCMQPHRRSLNDSLMRHGSLDVFYGFPIEFFVPLHANVCIRRFKPSCHLP